MTQRQYLDWLSHARGMLREACGSQLGDVQVIVAYVLSGQGVEFTLPGEEETDAGEPWPPEVVELDDATRRQLFPLRTVHRRLLEVMTREPKPAKRLSREAGYQKCNSYVRAALTELVRWGHAEHTPDGYRRPA